MKWIVSLLLLCFLTANGQLENGGHLQKIDGILLHYSVSGNGPILIVGHPTSGKTGYELTLQPLEEFFTIVYYDTRGTGKSGIPESLSDYAPEKITSEIEQLRKHLGVSHIWIFGHSDQSSIALEYALTYPENAAGLILTGTSFIGTREETFERRQKSEQKRAAESPWFAKVISDWDYMIANKTDRNAAGEDASDASVKWWCYDEASARKVLPIVREIAKAGRRKPIDGVHFTETDAIRQKYLDHQKRFPELKLPVLIVNGVSDTNNPPEFARKLSEQIPGSSLILVEKSGHFPWIENKEVTFGEIRKWLEPRLNLTKKF